MIASTGTSNVDGGNPGGAISSIEEWYASRWGISPGHWLWGTELRILFVMDGRINIGKASGVSGFGLGYVLDTLRDPSFAWWVRFKVDVANRDRNFPDAAAASHVIGTDAAGNKSFGGFRFTQDRFDLNQYDQVWFFGDNPGLDSDLEQSGDEVVGQIKYSPLEDAELKLLAEWMDRGGGVFATGDHGLLGASLCSRIPRVRTMRKWTHEQGVPLIFGDTRLQTLTATGESAEAEEGDTLPQQIQPVYRRMATTSEVAFGHVPHPLLCGSGGVITRFPDHMHEGEVIGDNDVDLTRPLGIPGYERPEYPFAPVVAESLAAGLGQPFGNRPVPRVVAYGLTTNSPARLFPLLGVYDGDRAEIGRVVVDSTWHHWFSMNLNGFVTSSPGYYRSMQEYYRNVGLWLATPAQRASMLSAATWGVLNGSPPMTFQGQPGPWEVGRRVIDVIGRTATRCVRHELVTSVLGPEAADISIVPGDRRDSEPCWSCIPAELLERAIVGSIGTALLDLTYDYQKARIRGERPRLDPDAIGRRAAEGVAAGHRLLLDSLARADAERHGRLATALRSPRRAAVPVTVRLTPLRVVAERLQFPDAADPVLADAGLALTSRVLLDEAVVATRHFDGVKVPPFDARGGVITLDAALAQIVVQEGERLTIELVVGNTRGEAVARSLVRFTDTLQGEPTRWIGGHSPDRAQLWRLWYRIEQEAAEPTDGVSAGPG